MTFHGTLNMTNDLLTLVIYVRLLLTNVNQIVVDLAQEGLNDIGTMEGKQWNLWRTVKMGH